MKLIKRLSFVLVILSSSFFLQMNSAKAYESGVHYYLTYIIGYWCGLGSEADTIALADYSVDKFSETDAGSHFYEWLDPTKENTRRIFHFPVPKRSHEKVSRGNETAWKTIQASVTEANEIHLNPIMVGIGMHTLQDSYAHEGFGPFLGHWSPDPDLPQTDTYKMVEAAEATWIALNAWSEKVRHEGCKMNFKDMESQIESWAALPVHSNAQLSKAWRTNIENIVQKSVSPNGLYKVKEFQIAFKSAAAHIRKLKN